MFMTCNKSVCLLPCPCLNDYYSNADHFSIINPFKRIKVKDNINSNVNDEKHFLDEVNFMKVENHTPSNMIPRFSGHNQNILNNILSGLITNNKWSVSNMLTYRALVIVLNLIIKYGKKEEVNR